MKYHITPEEKGTRLDKFLVEKMPHLTRTQIQKAVKAGRVLVNGKTPTPHHFLKGGDIVDAEEIKAPEKKPEQVKKNKSVKKMILPEITVIYEDANFLVIEKPTGILTHPVSLEKEAKEPALTDWLAAKYPEIKGVGEEADLRPGIVHRLDKESSGLMVIARTQAGFEHLKKQFQNREIKKEYRAWIYGKLANDTGTINFSIGRSRESGKMAARPLVEEFDQAEENQEGRNAETRYEVLESHPHRSLVSAFPLTGRTHQIRVHFFAMGHPLIGDPLYKIKGFVPINTPRLLLHAYKLTFKDLDGVEKTFTSPLPKEFDL